MTPSTKQQVQLERAAVIAQRDAMIVVPATRTLPDARQAWQVTRPTSGTVHVVHEMPGGHLVCDAECAAAAFGRYCAHRAAVRLYLVRLHEAAQTLRAAGWCVTPGEVASGG